MAVRKVRAKGPQKEKKIKNNNQKPMGVCANSLNVQDRSIISLGLCFATCTRTTDGLSDFLHAPYLIPTAEMHGQLLPVGRAWEGG